jgi:hypothetical protein
MKKTTFIYQPTYTINKNEKSKEGMFEDSEQMGSESTAVQTTRYVSIADGERAGGGGTGEGGNRMEAIVSGR